MENNLILSALIPANDRYTYLIILLLNDFIFNDTESKLTDFQKI